MVIVRFSCYIIKSYNFYLKNKREILFGIKLMLSTGVFHTFYLKPSYISFENLDSKQNKRIHS